MTDAIQKAREALDDDTDFRLGDIVETIKGANFWGEIIAFDNDGNSAGCTVLAIAPGFEGTKHVYPLKQIRRSALAALAETEVKVRALEWKPSADEMGRDGARLVANPPIGGPYIVSLTIHGQLGERWLTSTGVYCADEATAKAAAQADYERRIRSALVPPESRS